MVNVGEYTIHGSLGNWMISPSSMKLKDVWNHQPDFILKTGVNSTLPPARPREKTANISLNIFNRQKIAEISHLSPLHCCTYINVYSCLTIVVPPFDPSWILSFLASRRCVWDENGIARFPKRDWFFQWKSCSQFKKKTLLLRSFENFTYLKYVFMPNF